VGKVCQATDTNLKRQVASNQILPDAVAADVEWLARDAEVLARSIIRTSRRSTGWSGREARSQS
jgi:hypothetical protein